MRIQERREVWEVHGRKIGPQNGRISTASDVLRCDLPREEYIDYIEVKEPQKPLKTEFDLRLEKYNRRKRVEAKLKWTSYGLGAIVLGVIVYKFVLVLLYIVAVCTVGSFFVLSSLSNKRGQTDGRTGGQGEEWTGDKSGGMSGTVNVYGDGNKIFIHSKNESHVIN